MMGTNHQIRLPAFPPPICNTTTLNSSPTAAITNQKRTSNRNSTLNASNKEKTKNAIKQTKQKTISHFTTTITTDTCEEDMFRKASEQIFQEHLHSNTNSSNSNMSLWQAIKSDAASLLPLMAFLLLLSCTATPALATPVFVDNPSLAQFQSGRNIRHLPCIVRKSGRSGVCMFAIDCIKQNGTHLGTCIDRFYFGSCCQLKDEATLFAPEISDNSIDQNTISHFPHESTTLPTSTLFKLTTSDPHHTVQSSSNSISETVRNVTQSYLQQHGNSHNASSSSTSSSSSSVSNKVDTTPLTTSSSAKPIRLTTTTAPRQPPAHTTYKHSQFVVRTTPKPTVAPTTIKPPRRKTTIARPVLTTTAHPQLGTGIEVTTQPTKIVTFQIVETTTPASTDTNIKSDEVSSTQRPPLLLTTNRYRPRPTTIETPTKIIATTPKQAEVIKTTMRPKPLITRRPTTSSRPQQTRPRPSVSAKPTRRPPVDNNVNESVKPILLNITTTASGTGSTIHRRPTPTTMVTIMNNDELPTTVVETKVPLPIETVAQTTHAPRPRPKPTAEIVKVPKPTLGAVAGTTSSPAPKTTTTTTTAVPIIIRSTTQKPSAPEKVKPTAGTTTLANKPTTPEKESGRPENITTTETTSKVPVSSTTPQLATLTTETAKIEPPPSVEITTLIPGLITWTNEDNEPTTMNATVEWVSETNIFNQDKVTETASPTSGSAFTRPPPTTSTIISVATSISEVVSNVSSLMPKPERPSSVMTARPPKPRPTTESPIPITTLTPSTPPSTTAQHATTTTPATTTTTTTTTPKPEPETTIASTASTSSTSTTTTSTRPTEMPIELEESSSATSAELATEGFSTTGSGVFGTTEYNTEDYNGTYGSSTAAPVNALEGMDYRQICGRRMFPEPRIVGGSNAAFGRWPWQISLRQWRTSTYLHKCGAALLNENWAITAAHCVENVPPSDLLLRMGEYDLAEEEEPYGYQERRVQIVASHPQFDARTFEYDLALLRFYEPVVFQPNIIPVCVPNSDIDFVGQTAFVTGWGRLYENGPLPSVLQEVAVPVINNTICESMYRVAGFIEHIPHIFICAGWKKGGYDSCEGDSGGPMVLQREDDKRFQLGGVISWGIGCAEANQPGVYTRISEFRDWINQILQF